MARISLLAVAAFALWGCGGGKVATAPSPVEPSEPVAQTGLAVPSELVNDGLKLLGHPFDKKITYRAIGFPIGGESEQQVVAGFDPQTRQLTFSYAGSPSMPSETYELREDGVYGVMLGGNELRPALKAISAEYSDGMTWPTKGELVQDGGIMIDTVIKIVGREKVTVPAGEYDAVVITESGTIAAQGVELIVSGKQWYVEGIGAVKRSVDQTDPTGKTSNITLEALRIE